jgi:hypothetical protein
MPHFEPLSKLVVIHQNRRQNGRVIGIKNEADGTTIYMVEPLRVDFLPFTHGARIMRISSKDIENKTVVVEKHIV